jgi:hypothetical protein
MTVVLRNSEAELSQSLRGLVPESWCCVDCGVNTAPGFINRAQTEIAFIGARVNEVPQTLDDTAEVYTVHQRVWRRAGMEDFGGCLCVGCLERRIGRSLKPRDFDPEHPFNDPRMPASPRLRLRRGR